MDLRSKMASSLVRFFNSWGADSVYTPLSGSPVSCKAFMELSVKLQPDLEGQTWEQATVVTLLLSQLNNVPTRGETVTYDGVTYTIERLYENDGLTVQVIVK